MCLCPYGKYGYMNKNFTLDSAYDGLHLSVLMIRPEREPDAVLQLSHGLCGCKERYIPFMEFMAGHGIACVACDHRGHGASVLSRDDMGYMYKGGYNALVADMKLVSDWTRKEFPDAPLFMLGHSMGSMAAILYAKKYDGMLSGLLLCGNPGYEPAVRIAMLLTGLMNLFNEGRTRLPLIQNMASGYYNRKFASEGRMAWVCSDPQVRKTLETNPLCNFSLTANGMHNLLGMMVEANSSRGWSMTNPKLSVTFLSGSDDPCMGGEKKLHDAAKMMYALGYHNVTAAIFTDMRHEILNEVNRKIVWDDVLNFIRPGS